MNPARAAWPAGAPSLAPPELTRSLGTAAGRNSRRIVTLPVAPAPRTCRAGGERANVRSSERASQPARRGRARRPV